MTKKFNKEGIADQNDDNNIDESQDMLDEHVDNDIIDDDNEVDMFS